MNSRKIIIAAIVVLLVIASVGLYFVFFTPKAAVVGNGSQTGQTGSLPSAGNQSADTGNQAVTSTASTTMAQNFGVISGEPVLDYFVTATNTVTAIEPSGKIIQVTTGQITVINTVLMQNILSASFSYNGTKILVSFGDPNNPQASIFDISAKAWTPLAVGLQSPVWSPSDYRIAYLAANTSAGTETLATIDASKAKLAPTALVTLHAQDLAAGWPAKDQIVLYTKPSAYAAGSTWNFNLQNQSLTSIAFETPRLMMLWSGVALAPAAPMGLEFSSDGDALGGSIALTNASGNATEQLKFLTLPSKCLFASATSTIVVATTTALAHL